MIDSDAGGRADRSSAETALLLDQTAPVVTRVCRAAEVIIGLEPRRYLHAGPPIAIEDVPGPMRGALIGALLFEGEAATLAEAVAILDAKEVTISPCHESGAVGAMAGIITPRMPGVFAEAGSRSAFSPLNEGIGGAVRYGSHDRATLTKLAFLADQAAPLLDRAVRACNGIEMAPVIAEGLRRGDECHNRLVATSANLGLQLAPYIASEGGKEAAQTLEMIASNGHFALPFVLAAAKVIADSATGVPQSPVVTAMAGNGKEFGIQVSGLGGRWFLAPSPVGEPKLIDGASISDVTPTMGDSMITETIGLGAFALTAAPAISSFIGGTPEAARELVTEMRSICVSESSRFLLPYDGYRGSPVGLDVRLVAKAGVAPVINNGLAHRLPGRGRVGAGLTRIPVEPFALAADALRGQAERAFSS